MYEHEVFGQSVIYASMGRKISVDFILPNRWSLVRNKSDLVYVLQEHIRVRYTMI